MVKYRNYIISEDCGKIRIQNTETGAEKTVKVTTDKCCDFVFKCLKRSSRRSSPRKNFWTGCNPLSIKIFALSTYRQYVTSMSYNSHRQAINQVQVQAEVLKIPSPQG